MVLSVTDVSLQSRRTIANATAAGSLAAVMVWLGPPGTDFAAHLYQLDVFVKHGFALWTNDWYAGRYTFVGYSLLYYPLAALLGIKLLAVLSVAVAAGAFTLIAEQSWGEHSFWATRVFAVVTAASVLTAAFPYGLGLALALSALVALGRRRAAVFAVLVALTFAASPLAFLFLLVVLVAVGISGTRREIGKPAAAAAITCAVAVVIWRLFPDHGRFPFATSELLAALTFCGLGAAFTWRVERARVLRTLFVAYGLVCTLAYLVPSNLGENVDRLRYAAVPLSVLALSLRRWRPLPLCLAAFGLALSWNLTPLAWSLSRTARDPAESAAYWRPVVHYLHQNLTPSYRVEAVATAGHWEAFYFARAGIPIVRGWFRQDDFPQNTILYDELGPRAYLRWLHGLGVRYVVLSDAQLDYSARGEARLLRSGRSGLTVVHRTAHATVYAVPSPQPIVTGPGNPRVTALTESAITLDLPRPGDYRVDVRYSPYLAPRRACISETKSGMILLHARHAGVVKLRFAVTTAHALAALGGSHSTCPT
jgi:hypothetical protein